MENFEFLKNKSNEYPKSFFFSNVTSVFNTLKTPE
jgi:hypothetical protein